MPLFRYAFPVLLARSESFRGKVEARQNAWGDGDRGYGELHVFLDVSLKRCMESEEAGSRKKKSSRKENRNSRKTWAWKAI